MWRWIERLRPEASDELKIAARGQHICRWTVPRDTYERTRAGYLKWRQALKIFHAWKVGEIMMEVGAARNEIERVKLLILKKNLKDPETQTLEDALCLVFLETGFDDLRRKTEEEKMKEIVRKTWAKMSDQGHEAALTLPMSEEDKEYLKKVLTPLSSTPES